MFSFFHISCLIIIWVYSDAFLLNDADVSKNIWNMLIEMKWMIFFWFIVHLFFRLFSALFRMKWILSFFSRQPAVIWYMRAETYVEHFHWAQSLCWFFISSGKKICISVYDCGLLALCDKQFKWLQKGMWTFTECRLIEVDLSSAHMCERPKIILAQWFNEYKHHSSFDYIAKIINQPMYWKYQFFRCFNFNLKNT